MSSSRLLLLALVCASYVTGARAQQAGDPCTEGDPRLCTDDAEILTCSGGTYGAFPCEVVNGTACGSCDAIGVFCFNDSEIISFEGEDAVCTDPGCDTGGCDGTDAVECIDGYAATRTDCATTGRVCVPDDGTNSGSCVVGDSECGARGVGGCDGTVATICSGGTFVNTVDCADVGRRCGTLNDAGEVGCVEAPAPEPATPCGDDADCDDDETCADGECERERSSRPPRGGDDEEPKSCAQSGTLPLLPAVLMLLLRRRRS